MLFFHFFFFFFFLSVASHIFASSNSICLFLSYIAECRSSITECWCWWYLSSSRFFWREADIRKFRSAVCMKGWSGIVLSHRGYQIRIYFFEWSKTNPMHAHWILMRPRPAGPSALDRHQIQAYALDLSYFIRKSRCKFINLIHTLQKNKISCSNHI